MSRSIKRTEEMRAADRARHALNREAINKKKQEARAAQGEAWVSKRHRYYEENKDHYRDIFLRSKYGLSLAAYQDMLEGQQGGCSICGNKDSGAKGHPLYVDHDHKTGEIRALLCKNCNTGLGCFLDNPNILDVASSYLRKHRGML